MVEATDNRAVEHESTSRFLRTGVYLVVVVAVGVVLWALTEGDDRNGWTEPAAVGLLIDGGLDSSIFAV